MLHAKRTFTNTLTYWQLVPLLSRYVVSGTLLFVAILAEVGIAPAEPLGDRATEFTFELNEVGSVHATLFAADSELLRGARTAHEVLRFEFLLFLLSADAVLHASKVRFVASEALIESALEHCPLLQVALERGVVQSRILVDAFDSRLRNCLALHVLLQSD